MHVLGALMNHKVALCWCACWGQCVTTLWECDGTHVFAHVVGTWWNHMVEPQCRRAMATCCEPHMAVWSHSGPDMAPRPNWASYSHVQPFWPRSGP